MPYSFNDFAETVMRHRLSSAADLDTQAVRSYLNKAIQTYSVLRPLVKVKDYDGDNSTYIWTLPTDWVENFSQIATIEYPSGSQIPEIIKPYRYRLYRSATVLQLQMIDVKVGIGEVLRLTYTLPHTLSLSANTTFYNDFEAICDMAAEVGARNLAAKYAQTSSSTLQADAINYLTKVDYYLSLANRYQASWKEYFGMKPKDIVPAVGQVGDIDMIFSWGEDLIAHPRRHR